MAGEDKILELTKSLSLLSDSGLTIQEAIELTETIYPKGKIHASLKRIREKLEKGFPLSTSLKEESLFPSLYKGLIEIGENTGHINLVLKQLTEYLAGKKKITEKLQSAMIYPIILFSLILGGIGGLILVFIPRLQRELAFDPDVLLQLESSLASARVLLLIFALIILGGFLIPLMYRRASNSDSNMALILHKAILKFPMVKTLIIKREMLNIFFTLSLTTQCRIPLEESFNLVQLVVHNRYIAKGLLRIRDNMVKGDPLSLLFLKDNTFPKEIGRWIAMGERIGKIESIFSQLKQLYQDEVSKSSDRITALIEPAASLIIGIILVIVVIVLIVPLMTVYGGLI